MRILQVRNVHQALPVGIRTLLLEGQKRGSRNGDVLVHPTPVTTVYEKPTERVLFWEERDANPFFHLYESLWMLAGRNDVEPLARYAKQMLEYSDDGITVHGAYGYRWRGDVDQLEIIVERLRKWPDDRRSVLQMWDSSIDLHPSDVSRDVPCNLICTFQINSLEQLDLTVFCRSNDIIWGAYGANAVHFSMLQEYMAIWIGVSVGQFYQISVNWHAYLDKIDKVRSISRDNFIDPYTGEGVYALPIASKLYSDEPLKNVIRRFDATSSRVLDDADGGFPENAHAPSDPYFKMVWYVLRAHHYWKTLEAPDRYDASLGILSAISPHIDWVKAANEWIQRRQRKYVDGDTKQA